MGVHDAAFATYRHAAAGYEVQYPIAWSVDDDASDQGTWQTTFNPPSGSGAVVVIATDLPASDGLGSDIPNTRCSKVDINGLEGKQCFDSIAMSISTFLMARERSYEIATWDQGPSREQYTRILQSFRLLR